MAPFDKITKLQSIIDTIDGFIYLCSQDYRIEFMNERLIRRTGYDGTGEFCYRVLHDRDEVCPWCVNERVRAGETVRWEIQSPKDGRWYYSVNAPLRNEDGTVSKLSVIMDITENKALHEELIVERERYRAIVESQTDLICRFDSAKRISFVNSALARFYSAGKEEFVGKSFLSLVADEDQDLVNRHLQSLNSEKFLTMFDSGYHAPNGNIYWQQWSVRALFDDSGSFIEFQAVGRDITKIKNREFDFNDARKRLEKQVSERTGSLSKTIEWLNESIIASNNAREKLSILENALDLTGDIVMITDPMGIIEYVNARFTEATGYEANEVIGTSAIIYGNQKEPDGVLMWESIKKMGSWKGTFLNNRKDGSTFREDASISAIVIPGSERASVHYIKIARIIDDDR